MREKEEIFPKGGNKARRLAVYSYVVRQILVPFALLSLVPVTVVILFTVAIDSPSSSVSKAKKTADAVSAAAAEQS